MSMELARDIAGLTPSRATLHALVTRADGSTEDLGIIACTDEPNTGLVQRFVNNIRKVFS